MHIYHENIIQVQVLFFIFSCIKAIKLFLQYIINMKAKAICFFFAQGLLLVSGYIICSLIIQHNGQLQHQSILRFKFLLGIHIFLALSLALLIKIDQFYHQMLIFFFIFFITFIAIFTCETIVNTIFKTPHTWIDSQHVLSPKKQSKLLPLQLAYNDIYYLVYLYAIIGLVFTSIFILLYEILAWLKVWPSTDSCERAFENHSYAVSMKGEECSICLGEFISQSKLIKLKKCGHIFHDDCIRSWALHHHICPLDRSELIE